MSSINPSGLTDAQLRANFASAIADINDDSIDPDDEDYLDPEQIAEIKDEAILLACWMLGIDSDTGADLVKDQPSDA